MTYSWNSFEDAKPVTGSIVGFQQSELYDLSETGRLVVAPTESYVLINGYKLVVDYKGEIKKSIPSGYHQGDTIKVVTTEMEDEGAVGSEVNRTRGSYDEHHEAKSVLSTMEPRDHFAMNALNAMLIHADHPEAFSDETCLYYSRAAYRWAQAMMIAAADSRKGISEQQGSSSVEVNSEDLESNTEKILYNISKLMEKGVTIVGAGSTEENPMPVIVGGTEETPVPVIGVEGGEPIGTTITNQDPIPMTIENDSPISTTIDNQSAILVDIDGTPSVNVDNTVTVEGTVSVDNFPESEQS